MKLKLFARKILQKTGWKLERVTPNCSQFLTAEVYDSALEAMHRTWDGERCLFQLPLDFLVDYNPALFTGGAYVATSGA